MHVRISRSDPDDAARSRWTGQVSVAGAIPGGQPGPSGLRWQAAISGDDLRLSPPGGPCRVLPLSAARAAPPGRRPNRANARCLGRARPASGDHDAGGNPGESSLLLQPVISLLARGGGRAAALLDALAVSGVAITDLAGPPMLAEPAGSAWKPIEDTIVWAGRASIPGHPWLPPQPAHVWVTTRALRWSIDGVGACRLPVESILSAAPVRPDGQPAEAAVCYDHGGVRYTLPVRFDEYGSDRAHRERGAFLVALKSRGIRTQTAAPGPETLVRHPAAPVNPFRSAQGAAGAAPRVRPVRPVQASGDLATAREVEAELLEDLHRLNRALAAGYGLREEDRLGPRLGSGLADLDAAGQQPDACASEIAGRRARMLALAEATTRLRALLDQRERGLIDRTGVETRRQAIIAPLGDVILG
ncbi:MAG: hypothetical protein ACKOWF_15945 [Chloroflexota bacterium]